MRPILLHAVPTAGITQVWLLIMREMSVLQPKVMSNKYFVTYHTVTMCK